jgi:hypothetical protein
VAGLVLPCKGVWHPGHSREMMQMQQSGFVDPVKGSAHSATKPCQ